MIEHCNVRLDYEYPLSGLSADLRVLGWQVDGTSRYCAHDVSIDVNDILGNGAAGYLNQFAPQRFIGKRIHSIGLQSFRELNYRKQRVEYTVYLWIKFYEEPHVPQPYFKVTADMLTDKPKIIWREDGCS